MPTVMSARPAPVVFLQNPWFPPDIDPLVAHSYMHDVEFRRETLAKTMTGRRLLNVFGPMFYDIWWDNAHPTPKLGDHRAVGDPDPWHMLNVVLERRPTIIGTLGKNASNGIKMIEAEMPLFFRKGRMLGARIVEARHPNALGCTNEELEKFANDIINHVIGVVEV